MKRRQAICALLITCALGGAGCVSVSTSNFSSTSPSATPTAGTGTSTISPARAARVVLSASAVGVPKPSGSFNQPSVGTANVPGQGVKAVRLFNPDNSVLAASPSAAAWPSWLSSVEIGVSGGNNKAAPNDKCANFSGQAATNCDFGAALPTSCGAPSGSYQVSEYDCTNAANTALDGHDLGDGGPQDGVYIRATFDRTQLAPTENILAVIEYSANFYNSSATTPTSCFVNGVFAPANKDCSDFLWQIYWKNDAYQTVQPFLMLAPPAFNTVNTVAGTGGGGIGTRQFILPFAADQQKSVLQISRIRGMKHTDDLTGVWSHCPSGSAHCVGMVFYSLTFYRM